MQHKKIKLSAFLLLGIGLTTIQAQQTLTTSGGSVSSNEGSISYSVGQLGYTTSTSANGSLAQGVQQPFEISVINSLPDAENINLILLAFPNPTTNYFVLTFEGEMIFPYLAQLFDINGKIVSIEKIVDSETKIDMRLLEPSTYFLRVIKEDKEIKAFKIVKN